MRLYTWYGAVPRSLLHPLLYLQARVTANREEDALKRRRPAWLIRQRKLFGPNVNML